jgi:electron transport complex protein RnfD
MSSLLTISPSPHIHSGDSTKKIMYRVVYAMIPALLWSVFVFGLDALRVTLIAVAACIAFEYLIQKYLLKIKPTVTDGSALVTGILLAFNVPSNIPWWIIIVGAIAAVGIGKLSFGGLGNNIFNPALVGRVFLLISFPVQMTSWPVNNRSGIDAVTSATPLGVIKEGILNGTPISEISKSLPTTMDLFLGQIGGSLGEISAVLLILGGIYMLFTKVITWHIPVSIIATAAIFSGIFWMVNPSGVSYFVGWINAGCHFYGHRHGFVANDTKRTNYLRYWNWRYNHSYQAFWSLSRRYFICNSDYECFGSTAQPIH